ncbi:MAG: hypothetical protein ACERKZ_03615 [Lachnotalea sp.]
MEKLGEEGLAKQYFEQASSGTDEPAGMMFYNDQTADMILYQGLANFKLDRKKEAKLKYLKLIEYGKKHKDDQVCIKFFAVSLPDFLIFNEDLDIKNQAHCYYLIRLGNLGLGDREKAKKAFDMVLKLKLNHINCRRYM